MTLTINSASILDAYYSSTSPKTATASSSNNFADINADGDQTVSRDELSDYVSLSSSSVDTAKMFATMDTDGDDAVSQDEFTTYADAKRQQVELVLSTQQMMADVKMSIIDTINDHNNITSAR